MQLHIDNFDYTNSLGAEPGPRIERRLNRPSRLTMALFADSGAFQIPAEGARVVLQTEGGTKIFTGYVAEQPVASYLGWSEAGAIYRYAVVAISDEYLLDRKLIPARAPFLARSAGAILKELTEELLPASFQTQDVAELDTVPSFASDAERKWSEHAAELSLRARAAYRAHDGALSLLPLGVTEHVLDEANTEFSPDGLVLTSPSRLVNDVTVMGRNEPQAHAKDYFLGDGYSLSFTLSQMPFNRFNNTFVDEEFKGSVLDPLRWQTSGSGIDVSGGKLRAAGGPAVVEFVEQVEIGGALVLRHGDLLFTAPSSGVVGGLYSGGTDTAHLVAGFNVEAAGAQSRISVVANGSAAGSSLTTIAGRRYVLTTRIYASEIYRQQQVFHSSRHPSGAARGGAVLPASAHVVLEVHEIDLANPGSQVAPASVLYDGVISNAPSACAYLLLNATDMHAEIAFTQLTKATAVEVQSLIPGQAARTRLVGALSDGAECGISSDGRLYFYSSSVPVPNEAIRASYRSSGQARARFLDEASAATLASRSDDGVRGAVYRVAVPEPRMAADCDYAALALLDDSVEKAWAGEYQTWSDFLNEDVWPGDAVHVVAPSRGADCVTIVREVDIEVCDPANDRSRYRLQFANDAAQAFGFICDAPRASALADITATTATAGNTSIADLPAAEIVAITSTTVTIDAGTAPPSGGGIEVRRSDYGWGADNDRNLVGRFPGRSFTVTRLARTQTYYLRQYDSQGRYSRYATVLHVDYPY